MPQPSGCCVDTLLAAARPLRNRRAQAIAHLGLARALLLEGDDQRAESVTHDALKILTDHGWRPAVIDALDVLAEVAQFRCQYQRAVRLAAAADGQRTALGLAAFPQARKRTERRLADAGTALGDENLKKAFEEGSRLSLEEAVAYARRGRGEHAGAAYGWTSLSPVERQVTELASQGLNNPDIGQALFMSRNTVKVHLLHVYTKLGCPPLAGPRRGREATPSWMMFRRLVLRQPRFRSRERNPASWRALARARRICRQVW
jgi:DNA-binding CsgD family transcriptional regulator